MENPHGAICAPVVNRCEVGRNVRRSCPIKQTRWCPVMLHECPPAKLIILIRQFLRLDMKMGLFFESPGAVILDSSRGLCSGCLRQQPGKRRF